jgi:hypothetical protein
MIPLRNSGTFAAETLAALRADRAATRKRRYDKRSKLMRYRVQLVALRQSGASYRELVRWLGKAHKFKIDHTTVRRYLVQLPELQPPGEDTDAELSHTGKASRTRHPS